MQDREIKLADIKKIREERNNTSQNTTIQSAPTIEITNKGTFNF